ncbi:MAG: chitinase, partial [Cyclobacteriaceae bacterium]|nr:chitinase [Cyclobacteriaceae bacterium]
MAYYVAPRDNYHPEELPLDQLTHIIFSITEVIDNEMKFKHEESSSKLSLLADQKRNHPHLKVMIACGGWGGSSGFSDMAASPGNRKKFVDSSIKFMEQYDLDGLDIDWEYPGLRGAGNPYIPEDKENFTAL